MPASSVDTFFACSLMVILVVSAMAATVKVVQPHIDQISEKRRAERSEGLSKYLLQSTGIPIDWGKLEHDIPIAFGLASGARGPYELDPDKVSRLNGENIHSITYTDIMSTLGIEDMSLSIQLRPLFDVSASLASRRSTETETTYTFQLSTTKSGLPLSTWLKCYAVVGAHIGNTSSSTASNGIGFANLSLPNSLHGPALLVAFAKAKASSHLISFTVLSFGHNSDTPQPNKTFVRLSPLNHSLNVSFRQPNLTVSKAYVFTCNYQFNLSEVATGPETIEYIIPKLVDSSPMILTINGDNASTAFAEWTAYPQLPLQIGPDFADVTTRSQSVTSTHVVNINSVLYEFLTTCQSVMDQNA